MWLRSQSVYRFIGNIYATYVRWFNWNKNKTRESLLQSLFHIVVQDL